MSTLDVSIEEHACVHNLLLYVYVDKVGVTLHSRAVLTVILHVSKNMPLVPHFAPRKGESNSELPAEYSYYSRDLGQKVDSSCPSWRPNAIRGILDVPSTQLCRPPPFHHNLWLSQTSNTKRFFLSKPSRDPESSSIHN